MQQESVSALTSAEVLTYITQRSRPDASPSSPQLGGGDRLRQRAAARQIGKQHDLVLAEDRCCLGHARHAAERDHPAASGDSARDVADQVGDVLHLGALVVAREDDSVAFDGELSHAPCQRYDLSAVIGRLSESMTVAPILAIPQPEKSAGARS